MTGWPQLELPFLILIFIHIRLVDEQRDACARKPLLFTGLFDTVPDVNNVAYQSVIFLQDQRNQRSV